MRGLLRNLRAGMRAALLLRVDAGELRATPGHLVALVVLSLGLQLLSGIMRVGWDGGLSAQALPRALVGIPLVMLAGWLVALWAGRSLLLSLPILFSSIALVYDVGFEILDFVALEGWAGDVTDDATAWYALYAAWLAASLVGAARLAGDGALRRLYAMAVLAVSVALPLWHLPPAPLWVADSDAEDDDTRDAFAVSREEVFYARASCARWER